MSVTTVPFPVDHAVSLNIRRAVAAVVVLLHAGLVVRLWLTDTAPARPEGAVVMVSFVATAAPARLAPVVPPPPASRAIPSKSPPVLATERQVPADAAPLSPPEAPVVPAAATPPVVAVVSDATPGPAVAPAAVTLPSFGAAYLRNPRPAYPALSRRLGEQGTTYLRVQVNAEGRPQQVTVERGSGFDRLDRAAQAAVRDWRFVPAREGDKAVTGWVTVPITWKLEN